MDESREVFCPNCRTLLHVPLAARASKARCASCQAAFPMPRRCPVAGDTIAGWLARRDDDEPSDQVDEAAITAAAEGVHRELGDTTVGAAAASRIRLVRLDGHGALLEFPASRLRDADFRCAMPRKCLQCGTTAHLQAHVILFAPRFTSDLSLKAEHSAGRLVASEKEVAALEGEALLSHLPRVPNVPPPADRPMPYWLCDMCTGAGVVSGQIEAHAASGGGRCRLLIRSLRRAEEFLVAAGGKDTIDHRQIRQRIEAMDENPWETLPLAVRHRIEQWFRPAKDERLIDYIPDRDHARTEDGVAGLVLTNRRLIHHTPFRHHEEPAGDALEMRLAFGRGKGTLQIHAPNCHIKRMCLDREGVLKLRHALAHSNFRVAWR